MIESFRTATKWYLNHFNKPVIPVIVLIHLFTLTLSRIKECACNTSILNSFVLTSEKKDFRFLSENKLHCSDVRCLSKEDHEMHFIAQEKANKWFVFVKLRHCGASFKPNKCVEGKDVQKCFFTRKEVHSSVFYSLLTCRNA